METPLIIIVDDIESNILPLQHFLKKEGYRIVSTSDPKATQELAEMHKPDLIVLDIGMPEMNGIEVCELLKSNHATKEIPVIFLTVRSSEDTIVAAFNAGCTDYIIKPFHAFELITRIKKHIEIKFTLDSLIRSNSQMASLIRAKNEFFSLALKEILNPIQNIIDTSDGLLSASTMDHQLLSEPFKEPVIRIKDTASFVADTLIKFLKTQGEIVN